MITRIAHIILAFLLLISSAGLLLNKHYCQNELKSTALFVKATPCHQQKAVKKCPLHKQDEHGSKKCCDDHSELLKNEDNQLTTSSEWNLVFTPLQLSAVLIALQIKLPSVETRTPHYLNYKPPLIVRDLPVKLQTFLC